MRISKSLVAILFLQLFIPQAHAILGDGMLQVATLMLMKDSFDSQI